MSNAPEPSVNELVELGAELVAKLLLKESKESIRTLIEKGAPLWYQDEEGLSALHAACFIEDADFVQLLIEKGAIWNAVDGDGNTAADIVLSFNNTECYRIIRDAGIRAEFVLHLLASRGEEPDAMNLHMSDSTAAGSTDEFLKTRLKYITDQHGQEMCVTSLGNGEEVGVMMGWEQTIMEETVRQLCSSMEASLEGLNVLNVGFGLGIIDKLFQSMPTRVANHVIIEAHPDVLQHMRETGWYTRTGVTILEGKWQDFLDSEKLLGFGGFDIIYTDTFSEDYSALKQFFDHLPDLLSGPDARFSFFNGLGATNPTFYDVYTQVAELHLQDLGLQTQWFDVDVILDDEKWKNTREYFTMPIYRMPICRMVG